LGLRLCLWPRLCRLRSILWLRRPRFRLWLRLWPTLRLRLCTILWLRRSRFRLRLRLCTILWLRRSRFRLRLRLRTILRLWLCTILRLWLCAILRLRLCTILRLRSPRFRLILRPALWLRLRSSLLQSWPVLRLRPILLGSAPRRWGCHARQRRRHRMVGRDRARTHRRRWTPLVLAV
jgi:hypothetical protein